MPFAEAETSMSPEEDCDEKIVKEALVWPDGIVTLVGTVTEELFDDRNTTAPDVGALLEIVTVPVVLCPDWIVEGDITRLCNCQGMIDSTFD